MLLRSQLERLSGLLVGILYICQRPNWLRVDRLSGEREIPKNSATGRQEFGRQMERRRQEEETTMSLKWIAQRLHMGGWTHVSNLLNEEPRR